MRRRAVSEEEAPMSRLAALAVRAYASPDWARPVPERRELVLRLWGRLPTERDVARARAALGAGGAR